MLGKISIRLRLTLMLVALLTLCCVGLTVLLNFSADKVVEKISVSNLYPAYTIESGEIAMPESVPPQENQLSAEFLQQPQKLISERKVYFICC